jgi:hypothetical protein
MTPGIRLGEALRFRGHMLPGGTLYRPGDALKVETWWSVDQPIERDYSIGLYLFDSTGALITQLDGGPTGPFAPAGISQWKPGSVYRDDRELRLPWCLPTGKYQVRIAVYGWWDGVRLLPEGGAPGNMGDSLLLEYVTILSQAECR